VSLIEGINYIDFAKDFPVQYIDLIYNSFDFSKTIAEMDDSENKSS